MEDFIRQSGYISDAFKLFIYDFFNQNTAVLGLEVTAQSVPNMTVYVKPGRIYQSGQQGQLTVNLDPALTVTAAHPSYNRIDRICAQYRELPDMPETRNVMADTVSRQVTQKTVMTRVAGSIDFMVVPGVAASSPAAPTVPNDWVSLAQVTVRANTTSILQSDILDERPTLKNLITHTHSGGIDGALIDYGNLKNKPDLGKIGINLWQPTYTYAVGDIRYSASAVNYAYMECTVGGTSGTIEPSWPAIGQTIVDGTVTWEVIPISFSNYKNVAKLGDIKAKLPKADIRIWCIGSGDETTKIQEAMDWCAANNSVLMVTMGNFTATNLVVPTNLKMEFYYGVITQAAGAAGVLFTISGGVSGVIIDKPNLYGGNVTGYTTASTEGTRKGIVIASSSDVWITNPKIRGFDSKGIQILSLGASPVHGHSVKVLGGEVDYNYCNLECLSGAEYVQVSSLTATKGKIGVSIASGNAHIANSMFNDNVDGCRVIAGGNDAHGSFTGCTFNHNTRYALETDGVKNGHTFNGCHFYYGDIHIKDSKGIFIVGGSHLSYNNVYAEGGGYNKIADNFINGDNVVFYHGYNGTASKLQVIGNRLPDGNSADKYNQPAFYVEKHATAVTNITAEWTLLWATGGSILYAQYNELVTDGVFTTPIHDFITLNYYLVMQNISASLKTRVNVYLCTSYAPYSTWSTILADTVILEAGTALNHFFSRSYSFSHGKDVKFQIVVSSDNGVNINTDSILKITGKY
jgi:hypothetical protein